MKGLLRILLFLSKCIALYTLVVFGLTYWTPSSHWFPGFLMMSFPVAVMLNLVLVIFWLFVKPVNGIVSLFVVLTSLLFLPRTFSFKKPDKLWGEEMQSANFSVMNYNVLGFWTLIRDNKDLQEKQMIEMRKWIADSKADILCIPEYFTSRSSERVNVNAYFRNHGYRYQSALSHPGESSKTNYFGLIIFSRYPIVASRDTNFSETNGLVQADVKIKGDTVRIIAVHLYSMTLKLSTLVKQKKVAGIERESKDVLARMKRGFTNRAQQVQTLRNWIAESPYPLIVCGDFNETPYSYVYGKIREPLANAFEERGSGFGFTFNRIPYFIRIDHQFYDKGKLNLLGFSTERNQKFSDHYPLIGSYSFK